MARKAIYKHATQVDTSSYPDDGSSPVGSNEWNEDPSPNGMLGFTPQASTVTISSGALTITDSVTVCDAEGGGTSDTIDTVAITNTNEYDLLYLFCKAGETITLTNTSSPSSNGQVRTVSNSNETLSSTSPTILIRKGNYWYGYGGGVVNAVSDIGDVTISSIGSGEILKWNGSAWINQTLGESGIQGTLSNSDIATAVEAASDSNTFTDADHTKLNGIATSANNYTHTTNANLTGDVTSSGNATTYNNAVPVAKGGTTLTGFTQGDILYASSSTALAKLAKGTAGQALKMNSGATAPEWAAGGGGATIVHTYTNTTNASYAGTASSFSTVGVGDRDIYIKKIDSNNEGVFTKVWKNGSAVEVQIA